MIICASLFSPSILKVDLINRANDKVEKLFTTGNRAVCKEYLDVLGRHVFVKDGMSLTWKFKRGLGFFGLGGPSSALTLDSFSSSP
jgi:hypothetical protein